MSCRDYYSHTVSHGQRSITFTQPAYSTYITVFLTSCRDCSGREVPAAGIEPLPLSPTELKNESEDVSLETYRSNLAHLPAFSAGAGAEAAGFVVAAAGVEAVAGAEAAGLVAAASDAAFSSALPGEDLAGAAAGADAVGLDKALSVGNAHCATQVPFFKHSSLSA